MFKKQPAFKDKFSGGEAQKCEKCEFKTAKHEQMRQHILIKHSGVKNKCTFCDYTHYYPNRVKVHENHVHKKIPRIQYVSGKKNMVCNDIQCPQVGTKECNLLENHGRHFCKKCKYAAKRTSDLRIHDQRVHDEVIINIVCKNIECPKVGTKGCNSLEAHCKHFCKECTFSSKRKDVLNSHIQSVHEGVIFTCEECQYSSARRRVLTRHIQSVHE